jgi:hypothetical protein
VFEGYFSAVRSEIACNAIQSAIARYRDLWQIHATKNGMLLEEEMLGFSESFLQNLGRNAEVLQVFCSKNAGVLVALI